MSRLPKCRLAALGRPTGLRDASTNGSWPMIPAAEARAADSRAAADAACYQ